MPKQFKKVRMLALASAAITANALAGGKTDGAPRSDAPEPLTLNQIPHPLAAMIPPMNNGDVTEGDAIAEELAEDFSDRGVIFTDEDAQGARIDFVIGNLPPDKALDIVLAYTTNVAPFEDGDEHYGLGGELGDDDHLRSTRADGDQPPPPPEGQAGDGQQPPPDGQAGDGQQPPPDGQAGDGQQPPPDGQAGDGQQPPPDGQSGDGQQPRPEGQAGDNKRPPKVTHKPGEKPGLPPKDKQGQAPLIPNAVKAQAGESCLGDEGFEVVAGVSVQPMAAAFGEGTPSKLGKAAYVGQSVVVSVSIDKLTENFEVGDELFFQALAFPAGTFASGKYIESYNQVLVSECDRIMIDMPDPDEGELVADGDDSTPDSGGKDMSIFTDSGAIYEEDDEEYVEPDGTDEGSTGTDGTDSSGSKGGKVS